MRTGRGRGFTYLWLLFLLAIGAATLAGIGQRWSSVAQRERERELIFRGQQIAAAMAAYRAVPGLPPQWPRSLDELVEDRRGLVLQRHLRRVYDDPFTGAPDWVPILAESGAWRGVHSRSNLPAMIAPDPHTQVPSERRARVSDHRFLAVEVGAASAPAATPALSNDDERAVPR